jgi:hypothetical protein
MKIVPTLDSSGHKPRSKSLMCLKIGRCRGEVVESLRLGTAHTVMVLLEAMSLRSRER